MHAKQQCSHYFSITLLASPLSLSPPTSTFFHSIVILSLSLEPSSSIIFTNLQFVFSNLLCAFLGSPWNFHRTNHRLHHLLSFFFLSLSSHHHNPEFSSHRHRPNHPPPFTFPASKSNICNHIVALLPFCTRSPTRINFSPLSFQRCRVQHLTKQA